MIAHYLQLALYQCRILILNLLKSHAACDNLLVYIDNPLPLLTFLETSLLNHFTVKVQVFLFRSSSTRFTDGVLSPKTVRIMPARPVLMEGDPLYITCAVKDIRSVISHDTPYLTFELPEISHTLENEIVVSFRLGMSNGNYMYTKSFSKLDYSTLEFRYYAITCTCT